LSRVIRYRHRAVINKVAEIPPLERLGAFFALA
jgi:hypothetical protein